VSLSSVSSSNVECYLRNNLIEAFSQQCSPQLDIFGAQIALSLFMVYATGHIAISDTANLVGTACFLKGRVYGR